MSNVLTGDIRRRDLGVGYSPKCVLLLLADFASDDGTGIFASKVTLAAELETTRSTIQRGVKLLVERGFLVEVGTRNKGVIEYRINVAALYSVPLMERYEVSYGGSGPAAPVAERYTTPQHVEKRTQDMGCSGALHVPRSATPGDDPPVAERYTTCSGALHHLPRSATQTKTNQKEPYAREAAISVFGEKAVAAAEFWAPRICGDRVVPSSAVSVRVADAVIAMKLATPTQMRARAIVFSDKVVDLGAGHGG